MIPAISKQKIELDRCRELDVLVAAYFSEVLIEVNLLWRLVPRPFTIEMMASEMPAAIRPYSMAVAADSSARNARSIFMKAINGRTH